MRYRVSLKYTTYSVPIAEVGKKNEALKAGMDYVRSRGYEPERFIRTWTEGNVEYVDFGYGVYLNIEEIV